MRAGLASNGCEDSAGRGTADAPAHMVLTHRALHRSWFGVLPLSAYMAGLRPAVGTTYAAVTVPTARQRHRYLFRIRPWLLFFLYAALIGPAAATGGIRRSGHVCAALAATAVVLSAVAGEAAPAAAIPDGGQESSGSAASGSESFRHTNAAADPWWRASRGEAVLDELVEAPTAAEQAPPSPRSLVAPAVTFVSGLADSSASSVQHTFGAASLFTTLADLPSAPARILATTTTTTRSSAAISPYTVVSKFAAQHPCEPAPACEMLLGNRSGNRRHETSEQAPNSLRVFLEEQVFVDHVAVDCDNARPGKDSEIDETASETTLRQMLAVITSNGTESTGSRIDTGAVVSSSASSSTSASASRERPKVFLYDPRPLVISSPSGHLALKVPVHAKAVTVTIKWVVVEGAQVGEPSYESEFGGDASRTEGVVYSDSNGTACDFSQVAVMAAAHPPLLSTSPSAGAASSAGGVGKPPTKFRRRSPVNDTGGAIWRGHADDDIGSDADSDSDADIDSGTDDDAEELPEAHDEETDDVSDSRRKKGQDSSARVPVAEKNESAQRVVFTAETQEEHFQRLGNSIPVELTEGESQFQARSMGTPTPEVDSSDKESVLVPVADELHEMGFLAPSQAASVRLQEEANLAGVPVFAWVAALAIMVLLLPQCSSAYFIWGCPCRCGCCTRRELQEGWAGSGGASGNGMCRAKALDDVAYDRIPDMDTEAPFVQNAQEDPIPEAPPPPASGPQHFQIGTPDRTPQSSRASSPRPPSSPRVATSMTESEPEGELDPSNSGTNTPTGAATSPSAAAARAALLAGSGENGNRDAEAAPMVMERSEERASARQGSKVLKLLYASPLCHYDAARGPRAMPQIPFEREWYVLTQAYDEAAAALAHCNGGVSLPGVSLTAQLLTSTSLQQALAPVAADSSGVVLHLSAHSSNDCLVVEDGKSTVHLLSCDVLKGMLELRRELASGPRLVVLNACSVRAAGTLFAQSGVPHVICSSAELLDSASMVFMRALYMNLFQGSSVFHAFNAALVALKSSPDARTRALAESFSLLPHGNGHQEILFPPQRPEAPASSSSMASLPHLGGGHETNAQRWRTRTTLGTLTSVSTSTGSSSVERFEESSTDGPDESCTSEGHVDTSSDSDDTPSAQYRDRARMLPQWAGEACNPAKAAATREARRAWLLGPRGPGPPGGIRFSGASSSTPRRAVSAPSCVSWGAAPKVLHSPFLRGLPTLPEDFLGRETDVWSILQHVSSRRAVVVHGGNSGLTGSGAVVGSAVVRPAEHGIGKSAVLNAVHRAFTFQMGGVCVAVQMRALSSTAELTAPDGAFFWIERVRAGVRSAFQECLEQWWPSQLSSHVSGGRQPVTMSRMGGGSNAAGIGGVLRRRTMARRGVAPRAVTHGFHPLSDPIAVGPALDELVAEMTALAELCEARAREWPACKGQILLLLDECDHLIQQQHFQDAVADVLQRCAAYRVVLSTHQRMVGTAGGRFKVVHHPVCGLRDPDAAQLFLRRAQRPLRWGELVFPPATASVQKTIREAMAKAGATDPRGNVVKIRANEAEVLSLVAAHPSVAAQNGNPLRLIELASKLGEVNSLADLAPLPLRGGHGRHSTKESTTPAGARPLPLEGSGALGRGGVCEASAGAMRAPAGSMMPPMVDAVAVAPVDAAPDAETAPLLAEDRERTTH